MSNYSKEEIRAFAEKDMRISKLAMVKSLIEKLDLEDVYEVDKVTMLAEKYVDYVYAKRGQVVNVSDSTKQVDWEQIAIGLNLASPNSQNIKILNCVFNEYKKAHKASANPKDILVHITDKFGRYPAKTESVKKIVESLNLKG